MTTARDYLAAVQQRADLCGHYQGVAGDLGRTDVPRLVAALTAALDLHNAYVSCGNPRHTNLEVGCPECTEYCEACGEVYPCPTLAAITDALTPKENDS
jgi:hypothetical protein